MNFKKKSEKGFALVTAIGLTLVLTAVGSGALINSKSESKYSSKSVSNNLALEAAKSGVNIYFARINDVNYAKEIKSISYYTATGKNSVTFGNVPTYYTNLGVEGKQDVPSDSFIASNPSKFLIYDITDKGVLLKNTWDAHPKGQQVAVWVETYNQPSDDLNEFPYSVNGVSTRHHVNGIADAKTGLSYVVYSIGSHGKERKVVRERIALGSGYVRDLAAINNAPRYATNNTLCVDNTNQEDSHSDSDHNDHLAVGENNGSGKPFGDGLIVDSTQSYYTKAVKSNNSVLFPLDLSDPGFDYNNAVSSIVAGNMEPDVVYDPGKNDAVNYPNVIGSQMVNNAGITVDSQLFGTEGYLDYFSSADSQLFYIDAYREAANRISGYPEREEINGYKVLVDTDGLGNSKSLKRNNDDHLRTGTMSWNDFAYNVEHAIPMYGLVRVLVPTREESSDERHSHSHNICGDSNKDRYVVSISYDRNHDGHETSGDGHYSVSGESEYGSDHGDEGSSHEIRDSADAKEHGKVIVYGSIMFDFFHDEDSDQKYDSDEELLSYSKAMTVRLDLGVPVLVNPVADGASPINTGSESNYVAVGMYQNGSPSNSLDTDKLVGSDGIVDYVDDLVRVSKDIKGEIYNGSFRFSNYDSLIASLRGRDRGDMISILDYYHRTRAYSSLANYSNVSLSSIQNNKGTFYIDTKSDTEASAPSAADVFHVFMPTGYVHGWKRAFDVTGLSANDWNQRLIASDSPYADMENTIFYLPRVSGKDLINTDFKDVPAVIQTAGILNFQSSINVSGIVYNPGAIHLGVYNTTPKSSIVPNADTLASVLDALYKDCRDAFSNKDDRKACYKEADEEVAQLREDILSNPDEYIKDCKDADRVTVSFEMRASDGKHSSHGGSKKTISTRVNACSLYTDAAASTGIAQYISGATISGFGTFIEKSSDGEYVIVSYDDVATDNIPVGHDDILLRRTHWQEVY